MGMSFCKSVLVRGLSLAAFGLVLGAGAAKAQMPEASGWYVGVLGGLNVTEETSADSRIPGLALGKRSSLTGADAEISHKQGWGAGGLAGYDFGPFRLQADVIFRRNTFDKTTVSGVEADASGRVSSLAPMVSALYDIPTGTSLVPYIGAGVGASRTTVRSNGAKRKANGALPIRVLPASDMT
jgi:OmpA-OmpF porin, OOP family